METIIEGKPFGMCKAVEHGRDHVPATQAEASIEYSLVV